MRILLALFFLSLVSFSSTAQSAPLTKKQQKMMDKWLASEKAEDAYNSSLKKGDKLFRKKEFGASINAYEEALAVRPGDAYSIAKINDLKILLASMREDAFEQPVAQTPEPEPIVPETPKVPEPEKPKPTPVKEEVVEKPEPVAVKPAIPEPIAPPPPPPPPTVIKEKEVEKPTPKKVVPKESSSPKPAPKPTPKVKKEQMLDATGKPYPQGQTEEIIHGENVVIIKRIVVKGQEVDVYKKVTHNWGGLFYFKNEMSITQRVWQEETDSLFKK